MNQEVPTARIKKPYISCRTSPNRDIPGLYTNNGIYYILKLIIASQNTIQFPNQDSFNNHQKNLLNNMERFRRQISLTMYMYHQLKIMSEREDKPIATIIADIVKAVLRGDLVLKSGKKWGEL